MRCSLDKRIPSSLPVVLIWVAAHVDGHGRTALHVAASKGCLLLVEHIVREGGSTIAKTAAGHTPIFLAAANGHAHTVRHLSDTPNMTARARSAALVAGCTNGDTKVVEVLLTTEVAEYDRVVMRHRTPSSPEFDHDLVLLAMRAAVRLAGASVPILALLRCHLRTFPIECPLPVIPHMPMAKAGECTGVPETPLNSAIAAGNWDAAMWLIRAGASVFSKGGSTTLVRAMLAFRGGRRDEIVSAIVRVARRMGGDVAFEYLAAVGEDDDSALPLAITLYSVHCVTEFITAAGQRLVQHCDRMEYACPATPGRLLRLLAACDDLVPDQRRTVCARCDAVVIMMTLLMTGAALPRFGRHTAGFIARRHGRHRFAALLERFAVLNLTPVGAGIVSGRPGLLALLLGNGLVAIDNGRDNPAELKRLAEEDVLDFPCAGQAAWFERRQRPMGPHDPALYAREPRQRRGRMWALVPRIVYRWTPETHGLSPHRVTVYTVFLIMGRQRLKLAAELWLLIFSFLTRDSQDGLNVDVPFNA